MNPRTRDALLLALAGVAIAFALGIFVGLVYGEKKGDANARQTLAAQFAQAKDAERKLDDEIETVLWAGKRAEALNALQFAEYQLAVLAAPLGQRARLQAEFAGRFEAEQRAARRQP